MSDILTQIQDELDILLNQMYTTMSYIRTDAPPAPIEGQPALSSFAEHEASQSTQQTIDAPKNTPPEEFASTLNQFSNDIVLKEQQLEILFNNLPGMGISEKEQVERMKELQRQLDEIEPERLEAVREKDRLIERVEKGIVGVGGV
ncbi:mediator complex, subunit Med21 [Dendryphion nanum]|uniref:Mediator of RNA polymerase II transcription subunit 21 n=1 Tax=Dendryphion nanum TaxID=256645 RepID=A0A9P9IQF1_9PLEO|nr:mediator complex, subunit Med21 [Dendryphion nanum]